MFSLPSVKVSMPLNSTASIISDTTFLSNPHSPYCGTYCYDSYFLAGGTIFYKSGMENVGRVTPATLLLCFNRPRRCMPGAPFRIIKRVNLFSFLWRLRTLKKIYENVIIGILLPLANSGCFANFSAAYAHILMVT